MVTAHMARLHRCPSWDEENGPTSAVTAAPVYWGLGGVEGGGEPGRESGR